MKPLVIAHRGCSAERPEHTIAAYERAIEQGADYIEPDLVFTKDGVLIARHENEISGTTDVADHPEFASRRRTTLVDGVKTTGWFTEDFTWAEIRTLRSRERLPQLRPRSRDFDGRYPIPSAREVFALAKRRGVGVYPELKHPDHFRRLGLSPEALLARALRAEGFGDGKDVFVQCFDVGPLRRMRALGPFPLVQLISATGASADATPADYPAMRTLEGLARVREYAEAVGVEKTVVTEEFLADAHRAGLKVHVWTLRPEPIFVDRRFGGDAAKELAWFAARADGLFLDRPSDARSRTSQNVKTHHDDSRKYS